MTHHDESPDEIAELGDQLAGYMLILERLVAEPVSAPGGAAPGLHGRKAEAPLPGNAQALNALLGAHEGIRRLEVALKATASGGTTSRDRRGGSAGNTAVALEQLPKLAAAVSDGDREMAVFYLTKWINEAKAVHGIDEATRWRPLPRRPGEGLPPRCPYCRTFQLRADVDSQVVACTMRSCRDRNGVPPVATYAEGPQGRPRLYWADGLIEIAPELERT